MIFNDLIINNKQDLYRLCSEHQVKSLFAFGSVVTENFDMEKSDIDLLVEFDEPDPLKKGEKILSFWNKLEDFFKRKVDLLTNSNIRNPYLKQSIDATKVLIYEASK